MALNAEQLARLASRFEGLRVGDACAISDSFFRPSVSLGDRVTIAWSRIGRETTVGADSRIENATIGDRCAIGTGCVIGSHVSASVTHLGNGVRLGPGVIVAAGVVIPDSAEIPAHSHVAASPPGAATAWDSNSNDPDDALPLREFIFEKLPLVRVHKHWLAARGDQTLRVDYPLAANDLVLDVGGFKGDWAEQIADRYASRLHVYEPVTSFAHALRRRLGAKATVHAMGLAGRSREEQITLAGESSSVVAGGAAEHETIKLVAAAEVLSGLPGEIALMKINIEGCEYELLEHLLERQLIGRIRFLQVQFHDFVPDARARRRAIRSHLQRTHLPAYNYPFIWEGWTRRA